MPVSHVLGRPLLAGLYLHKDSTHSFRKILAANRCFEIQHGVLAREPHIVAA